MGAQVAGLVLLLLAATAACNVGEDSQCTQARTSYERHWGDGEAALALADRELLPADQDRSIRESHLRQLRPHRFREYVQQRQRGLEEWGLAFAVVRGNPACFDVETRARVNVLTDRLHETPHPD
jgi:hypothetical protein